MNATFQSAMQFWVFKLMLTGTKPSLCCGAAKRLFVRAVAILLPLCTGFAAAAQERLSYPYLDGSEAAFPNHRGIAERAARGYALVTVLARPDPVTREGGGEIHTASGIVLDREGYILTAAHIARGPQFDIRVRLASGRTLPGAVVRVSPKQELALVKTGALPETEPLVIADSGLLREGDPALALGSPRRAWGVVSIGRIRSPNIGERLDYGSWGFNNAIEIGLEVETGHSGGPLVNAKGELIGMIAGYVLGDTTKPTYRSPRIAYAVPSNDIRKWLGR
jgi:S1-C subfamily serine protease